MTVFQWGSATDVGRVRGDNQDQLLVSAPLFVVADGMGGHNGGAVAAAIAVDELAGAAKATTLGELIDAIEAANRAIVDRSKLTPELRGMGTTLVAMLGLTVEGEPRLGLANVGDSRAYVRADGRLVQLSEDHTLVEALVRDGRLTPQEAQEHPQRNIVTRALGIDERVMVDTWSLVPVVGDRYVLCSDGLFGELGDDAILEVIDRVQEPDDAASELVAQACEAGGRDNVTVVVIDIVESSADPAAAPPERIAEIHRAMPDAVKRGRASVAESEAAEAFFEVAADEPVVAKSPFVTWRVGAFVLAVLLVIGVLIGSVVAYANSGYFVGADGDDIVIFEGRPDGVLWFDPSVKEAVALRLDDLEPEDRPGVVDGVEFDSLDEAREYADSLVQRAAANVDEP